MSDSQNTALLSAAEEIEKGHPWISAVAASAIIRKHLQHAQQADVEAPVKPRVKTLSEVIDGMTRWIEHHEQKAVYAEINVATVMSWRVELSALRADLAAIGERHGRHAASSTEQPGAERALSGAGVFKGAHGLRGLAEAKEFWDQQPYGTRLYYGPGITDYLHHSVLKSAVNILDSIQPMDASQQGGVPEAIGFRWRMSGTEAIGGGEWNYVYQRAPDSFELRECVIESVYVLTATPSTAGAEQPAIECHKLDTPTQVFFYEQDFYVLSNFSAFRLSWQGLEFDTSEAAYHWEKFPDAPEVRDSIRFATSAHEAFKVAERYKAVRRPDWDLVKVGTMKAILIEKALQHEYVRRKLLSTGDRDLIEDSWRDDFWGWGPNRDGQNMLGKLWMEIRAELRAAAQEGKPS